MDRTNALDNVGRQFSEGNPQTGQPATVVGAIFLNGVQGEIINAIEDSGQVASDADLYQLKKAILALSLTGTIAANSWVKIGGRLILQWVSLRTQWTTEQTVAITWPTSFPNSCVFASTSNFGTVASDFWSLIATRSATGCSVTINSNSPAANPLLEGIDVLALGY